MNHTRYIFMALLLWPTACISSFRFGGFTKNRVANNFKTFATNAASPLQLMYNNLSMINYCDINNVVKDPMLNPHFMACLDVMSKVSMNDLGLADYKFSVPECMSVVSLPNFHIAVFLVPRSYSLPLHDHPNMAVASKLVSGKLNVRSYSSTEGFQLEKLNVNKALKRCILNLNTVKTHADPPWVLSATQGNFHELSAVSDCAMLDVLLPPYDEGEGRRCKFYCESAGETTTTTTTTETERPEPVTLVPVPEAVVVRQYILPTAVPYAGYVPVRSVPFRSN
jgi:hypothetical protein